MDNPFTDSEMETSRRRDRLSRFSSRDGELNQRYSRFVRALRLFLPVAAVMIITVIFVLSTYDQTENIVREDPGSAPGIGKNELINPRFESTDEKNQNYTITASRALQQENDENLVVLEEPVADILLNSGNWLALKADQGAFRQDNERLLLKGNVAAYHDDGYQMETEILHFDLAKSKVWTEGAVYGQGPRGSISAASLQADEPAGHVIFSGPARLVINNQDGSPLRKLP